MEVTASTTGVLALCGTGLYSMLCLIHNGRIDGCSLLWHVTTLMEFHLKTIKKAKSQYRKGCFKCPAISQIQTSLLSVKNTLHNLFTKLFHVFLFSKVPLQHPGLFLLNHTLPCCVLFFSFLFLCPLNPFNYRSFLEGYISMGLSTQFSLLLSFPLSYGIVFFF